MRWFDLVSAWLVVSLLCAVSFSQDNDSAKPALGDKRPADWAVQRLIQSVQQNQNEARAFPVQLDDSREDFRDLPVGVFDSGIGGLTVLEALLTVDMFHNRTSQPGADGRPDLENERFIYFGDQANMPYGNYPSVGKEDFLRERILQDALFLLGDRYWASETSKTAIVEKPPVKAIVIACNTATAYGLQDLRDALAAWKLPIITVGVVEAGATAVVDALPRDGNAGTIAVLATVGTCHSQAYPQTIQRLAGQRGRRFPNVIQQGSLGLAGAIEGDPTFLLPEEDAVDTATQAVYAGPAINNPDAPLDPRLSDVYAFETPAPSENSAAAEPWRLNSVADYIHYDATTLVEGYRRSGGDRPIQMVMLGCTHFPFERERIQQEFDRLRTFESNSGERSYAALVSEQLQIVDPAELTGRELYQELFLARRLTQRQQSARPRDHRLFVSVPDPKTPQTALTSDGWFTREFKYGRDAGNDSTRWIREIPMQPERMPDSIRQLIQARCPNVWKIVEARVESLPESVPPER